MVDSRAKGARGETVARDALRKLTGLQWERVPGSGALDEKHKLKGDLYVPGKENLFCIEVKNYEEDAITSKLLTSSSPPIIEWWVQAERQGSQVGKLPMLIFKHNRSKLFVAQADFILDLVPFLVLEHQLLKRPVYICELELFIKHESPKFIK